MLPENVTTARSNAETAATTAANYASGSATIGDVLKQKVLDAYSNNQDIIAPLDTATSNYVSAPATARAKYSDIFNPAQREALVSQYTSNQAIPVLSLGSVLGQRFGRIDDTIGAGTRAYQAETAAKQAAAEIARQGYLDSLNEYQLTKPSYDWLDLGGTKALVDQEGNIIKSYTVTDKDGSSGGGGWPGNETSTNNNFSMPTEPMPAPLDPEQSARTGIEWHSPLGQWYWDTFSQGWIPVI